MLTAVPWFRRRRRAVAVLASLVAVTLVSGCTGDDPDEAVATTTTELSTTTSTVAVDPVTAQFLAEANAICRTRNDQIARISVAATVPDSAKAMAKSVGISRGAALEVQALTPPPGDEQQVAAFLAAAEEIYVLTIQEVEAILNLDTATGQALHTQVAEKRAALNSSLKAYGLTDCVQ